MAQRDSPTAFTRARKTLGPRKDMDARLHADDMRASPIFPCRMLPAITNHWAARKFGIIMDVEASRAPNGPPVMSLVNGTLLMPLRQEGDWMLVAAGCDLTPTFAWSWTAGVPLNRCWVWF